MSAAPSTSDKIFALLRAELTPNPARTRAFVRTLAAVILSGLVVLTFKPPSDFWAITFVLFVSSPSVGNSGRNAIDRVTTTLVGATVAVLLVIVAIDQPYLFVVGQALGIGLTLFLARATPFGPVVLTGGAAFVVVTGADWRLAPAGWITLGFYRVLQGAIGSGLGALAQLTFWPDDPLVVLRRSLEISVASVEARLRGEPIELDPASLGRQLELLQNAEVRHPGIAHHRAALCQLMLDTARLVDDLLDKERSRDLPKETSDRIAEGCASVRRVHDQGLFEPPPIPPPPSPAPLRLQWSSPALWPSRRVALKTALSAFLAALFANVLRVPVSGALFPCLLIGIQVSTGTSISKTVMPLIAVVGAVGVVLLVYVMAMPNVEDLGSFLIVSALALAPAIWLTVGGPRVRTAGFLGTILIAQSLFGDFSASDALEPTGLTFVAIVTGIVVVGVVDRLVWPVNRRVEMFRRLAMMMHAAAALYREPDPALVLAPNRELRFGILRNLAALVQLRGEQTPLPGTSWFAPEETVLRLATETQHQVVARVIDARAELAGAKSQSSAETRERTAAALDEQARNIESGPGNA